jgi:hypothetical protein
MKQTSLAVAAVTLLAVASTSLYGQGQSQNQAPRPVRSRAEETVGVWNAIGNKLIAMAEDFPEDKYDFKLQKEQRTFAEHLLHVAAVDYDIIRTVSGSNIGPGFGKNKHNPSRDLYRTKADVVKLMNYYGAVLAAFARNSCSFSPGEGQKSHANKTTTSLPCPCQGVRSACP